MSLSTRSARNSGFARVLDTIVISIDPDPIADLEACDDLLNDLQRSVFRVAEGIALFAGGEYMTSDNPKATTIVPYGCYTFGFVAIPIPIQDLLLQPASDTTTPVGFEISAETETPTEPATLIDYP